MRKTHASLDAATVAAEGVATVVASLREQVGADEVSLTLSAIRGAAYRHEQAAKNVTTVCTVVALAVAAAICLDIARALGR